MERHVYQSFEESTLEKALHLYPGVIAQVQKLTESESFVYAFTADQRPLILRITPESHRTIHQIESEIGWIYRLRKYGIRAAAPVAAKNGAFVNCISGANLNFSVVAFEKARGHSPVPSDWSIELVQTWGQFVGGMHRVSLETEQSGFRLMRPTWDEEYNVRAIDVIAEQATVLQRHREYVEYLRSLPKDPDGYGIIHSDFETENFFLDDDGSITGFDFDESQYHWYVYDIAAILRQASWTLPNLPFPMTLQAFYEAFMAGYTREHTLSAFWVNQIPRFVQWREICMYVFSHGKQNTDLWTPGQKEYFSRVRHRIEHDIPLFQLNYQ